MKSALTSSVDHLLSVIANPTRKTILKSLSEGPSNFTHLMERCGMEVSSQCGVFSFHLRKLLAMNFVDQVDDVYFITYFGRKVVPLLESFERDAETTFSYPTIWTEVMSSRMRIRRLLQEEKEKYVSCFPKYSTNLEKI